jgi:Leucine-rich repeat (LRR) protein
MASSSKKTKPFRKLILLEDEPARGHDEDALGTLPYAETVAGTAVGTEGPFTIGVFADWGLGKTSVLRQAKSLIDDAEEPDVRQTVTVWFNAWQFEREDHPIIPLTATIVREMEKKYRSLQSQSEKLSEKATGVWKTAIRALRSIAYGFSAKGKVGVPGFGEVEAGFVAKEMIERFEKLEQEDKSHTLDDPLLARSLYYNAFELLDQTSQPEKKGPKVVVFIDDLDRCMPDKAVMLLENIKLVFGQRGFVFVLAVARKVLDGFLTHRYDKEFNVQDGGASARSYLDKIVQLPLHLPSHQERFAEYIHNLMNREALKDVKDVFSKDLIQALAVASDNNPRSLVRFLNNLLVDRFIYESKGQDDLKDQFLPFCIVSRCLQNHIEYGLYRKLVEDKELCDAIVKNPGIDFSRRWEFDRKSVPEDTWDSKDRIRKNILDALGRPGFLHHLLDDTEAGRNWLGEHKTRHNIDNFLELERPETNIETDQKTLIENAIRESLGIDKNVPLTDEDRQRVERLALFIEPVTDDGLVYLKELKQLQTLYLSGTQVTDAGLVHLKELKQLQSLDLSFTQVTDAGLVHLKELKQLQSLEIGDTQVTDDGLVHLKELKQLQKLYLGRTQVTDDGLVHLKELKQLQSLNLNGTQVTDDGLVHLKELKQLQRLDLIGTQVTDAGLAHLEELKQLQILSLDGTKVTDAGLAHLEELKQLQGLGLSHTQVTDDGFVHLKELKQLQRLGLGGTQVTDDGVEQLRQALPECNIRK